MRAVPGLLRAPGLVLTAGLPHLAWVGFQRNEFRQLQFLADKPMERGSVFRSVSVKDPSSSGHFKTKDQNDQEKVMF